MGIIESYRIRCRRGWWPRKSSPKHWLVDPLEYGRHWSTVHTRKIPKYSEALWERIEDTVPRKVRGVNYRIARWKARDKRKGAQ